MGTDKSREQSDGARIKKLIYAFRFIQGGDDPNALCEKKDGVCTGKSKLNWQIEEGVYTDICPVLLLAGCGRLHTFWRHTNKLGLPLNVGWYQHPNRWIKILGLCEDEYGRMNAAAR